MLGKQEKFFETIQSMLRKIFRSLTTQIANLIKTRM